MLIMPARLWFTLTTCKPFSWKTAKTGMWKALRSLLQQQLDRPQDADKFPERAGVLVICLQLQLLLCESDYLRVLKLSIWIVRSK